MICGLKCYDTLWNIAKGNRIIFGGFLCDQIEKRQSKKPVKSYNIIQNYLQMCHNKMKIKATKEAKRRNIFILVI